MRKIAKERRKALGERLDALYETFDLNYLSPDPLEFLHKFKRPEDIEITGLLASSLAYGRVAGIRKSITRILDLIEWHPYDFTISFDPLRDKALFDGFRHRFNTGDDVAALFLIAGKMIEDSGSIGAFFLKGYHKDDETIRLPLASFCERALALNLSSIYGDGPLPKKAGIRYFFPSPASGSACKRLNLYLRWMIRRGDTLDFGLWKGVDPAKLIIPLDTHIARLSRNIGLTTRRSPDWKMAEEITAELHALSPSDPVKYDFALCRLGILEKCTTSYDVKKCEACLIKEICVL